MKTLYRNTFISLVIISLTACGGGGGSSGNGPGNDRGTNTPGISANEALQLLAEGVYEFDVHVDYDALDWTASINMGKSHIGLDNGLLKIASYVTTSSGWMTDSDYYASIGSTESRDMILTATGWRERAAIPCNVQADGNAVVWDCAGNRSRMILGTPRSLGGTPVANELLALAEAGLAPLDAAPVYANGYAAVQNAVAALTTRFTAQARLYSLSSVREHDHVTTLECAPTAANQPESEWSCYTNFTSTSWEELDTQNEAFDYTFTDTSGHFRSMQVYLNGDLVAAGTGNMVLVEDYDGDLTPGSVVGTWKKVRIHDQDIIVLTATGQRTSTSNSGLNALMMINGKIVEGRYEPVGSRYTGNVYNAAAGNLLSDIGIDLFPLSVED